MGTFGSRNGDQMGTKWGPKKRIFDKLIETCKFIEINSFLGKNIHGGCHHLVHSVCAIFNE